MVEIEIGVLRGQCLDCRIVEREVLISEIEPCSVSAMRLVRASTRAADNTVGLKC